MEGTTTDNGANFVKAFDVYGPANHEAVPIDVGPTIESSSAEDVDEVITVEYHEIAPTFDMGALPNHFRCVSHTLNLLATRDISKVPGWSTGYQPCFRKVNLDRTAFLLF